MHSRTNSFALGTIVVAATAAYSLSGYAGGNDNDRDHDHDKNDASVQLGPRPFYLVDGMDDGPLKNKLSQCKDGPFHRTDFSIGHRGGALMFPEHTKEAYNGGARM